MKLIDLLVEMSKGNYPDKFKTKDENMIYHKVNNIYINEDGVLFDMYFNIFDVLNEEVEILGGNKDE